MPQVTDEEGNESRPARTSFNIIAWWRKFHFSGRVIACSVLLGLGLILIGSLIFAINITDDSGTSNDSDGASGQIPTKAPANFTGPVVMGIGGFIVIVGVIMCLFETQVCRKRTGDSSPLISEKTDDPERKDSDAVPGPSTSHGHKIHRHGARKACTSPKKSKCRHAKSRSKERNQQKSPSPKSPAVPIKPSKGFMTSSEDNFLTPPNTLNENAAVLKKDESCNSETEHSALMKSFNSSIPSWNQSSEFLTPSTSFRDTSVSLNNSVEVDESQDGKRFKDTELPETQNLSSDYMTPLTLEEDRIQQLLIRVQNEQKQVAESKKETKVGASARPEKNINSSQSLLDVVMNINDETEKTENEAISSDMLLPGSKSAAKDVIQQPTIQVEDPKARELGQNSHETNTSAIKLNLAHNEALNKISDEDIKAAEDKIPSQNQSTSLTDENKDPTLVPVTKEDSQCRVQGNDGQGDLDSSISSDETVVSPDSFHENAIPNESSIENSTVSTLKEDLNDESKSLSGISESLNNDTTAVNNDGVDPHNAQEDFPHQDHAEAQEHSLSKNDDVEKQSYDEDKESKDETS